MSLESASFISQLVPSNPTQTDPIAQFYAHVNTVKQVLQNQFPNVGTVAVTATAVQINNAASAFASGRIQVTANGTVASAELDLLGLLNTGGTIVAGRVQFVNAASTGAEGSLQIKMTDTADASGLVALTLSREGNLTIPGSLFAASVQQTGNPLLPSGVIVMWSGAIGAVPSGWVICNGTLGTPDLRDRFVVGAGQSYAVGARGGATTGSGFTDFQGVHTHSGSTNGAGTHNHTGSTGTYTLSLTDMPAHAHSISDPDHFHAVNAVSRPFSPGGTSPFLAGGSTWDLPAVTQTGVSPTFVSTNSTGGTGGAHQHGVTTEGNHSHGIFADGTHNHAVVSVDILPPFYALCFIMKQ